MLWNKRLETGIEQIDEQHKELFRRIDALNDVGNKNRIPETLAFLQEYVIKHFTDEQLIHKSVSYTKASTHAGYHDAFIKTLKDLIAKVNREGTTLAVTINVSQIVTTWLTDHILVHDMEFSRFYRNKKQEER